MRLPADDPGRSRLDPLRAAPAVPVKVAVAYALPLVFSRGNRLPKETEQQEPEPPQEQCGDDHRDELRQLKLRLPARDAGATVAPAEAPLPSASKSEAVRRGVHGGR
jgi:hypothetical protein